MRALFLLYDGYVDWEISALSYMLNISDVEVNTVGLNDEVTHQGNFKIKPDFNVEVCSASDYDILIIPGGTPSPYDGNVHLQTLIRQFDDAGKWIAAICGGPAFLAKAGILRDRKFSTSIDDDPAYLKYFDEDYISDTDVTVCENLITAEGPAYIEFAVEAGKALNIFEDREDELETVLFFKNQLRS